MYLVYGVLLYLPLTSVPYIRHVLATCQFGAPPLAPLSLLTNQPSQFNQVFWTSRAI